MTCYKNSFTFYKPIYVKRLYNTQDTTTYPRNSNIKNRIRIQNFGEDRLINKVYYNDLWRDVCKPSFTKSITTKWALSCHATVKMPLYSWRTLHKRVSKEYRNGTKENSAYRKAKQSKAPLFTCLEKLSTRARSLHATEAWSGHGSAIALPFPPFALLNPVLRAELILTKLFGRCGYAGVTSLLGVTSSLAQRSVALELLKWSLILKTESELYRPSDRRLSAKLVSTFADRGVSRNGSPWPYCRLSRPEPLLFLPSSSSIALTRLSGPCSRPTTS
jgi:hypothetical protein